MAFSRKLLLVGGIPALTSLSVPFIFPGEGNVDVGLMNNENLEDDVLLALLKRAGLNCWRIDEGSRCQIGVGRRRGVEIRQGTSQEEDLYYSSGGRLVIHRTKDTNYKKGLRFTVEEGDIDLRKGYYEKSAPDSIQRLERFESYGLEIEGEEGSKKLFLTRRATAAQGIMEALGLPTSCALPANVGDSTTCNVDYNKVKNVHFKSRKYGGATAIVTNKIDTKKVRLTVAKTSETNPFNGGYRFTFTPDVDLEISSGNTIKKDQGTDFRVIEWRDRHMELERAWKDSDLIRKVGLSCSNGYCTVQGGSLRVMQDGKTITNATATMNGAKIRFHGNENNYENGLKFLIEDGDISVSGTGSGINKLSRYEGYEIVNRNNEYYLNRRHLDIVEIVKLLGEICNIAGSKNLFDGNSEIRCASIPSKNFKNIRFDGKNIGMAVTSSSSLTIERTSETQTFRYGYKFKFTSDGDIDISRDNKLRRNSPTYFKIKGDGENMTLERAVKPNDLLEKVGLECSGATGNETCNFKENRKINVTLGHLVLTDSTPLTGGDGVGTLRLVKRDDSSYNEGLKFEVQGGDITFKGNGGTDARMGEFDTYEIKESNGRWHLHQKSNFMQNKHNAVGIPQKCNNAFSNHCTIDGMGAATLHFKEKKSEKVKATFSSNAKIQLQLHRESMYNYGIKVSMKAIGGSEPHVSIVCADYDISTLFKVTKDEMEFRIEKDSNDGSKFILVKQGDATTGLATDCTIPNASDD